MRFVIAATLLLGCTEYERHVVVHDKGSACLYSTAEAASRYVLPTAQAFTSDRSVIVRVDIPTMSYCDRDVQAWCGVERDGSTLRIDSLASFIPWDGACVRLPGGVSATCETGELDAGTYTVAYGSQTTTLTVPSTVMAPCVDAAAI